MHSANCNVHWRINNVLGLFIIGHFVPVKGNLNATAFNDIVDNSVEELDWPATNSDLNPTEHLWD